MHEIFTDSMKTSSWELFLRLNLKVAGTALKVVELAAKFLSEAVGALLTVDSPRMKQ